MNKKIIENIDGFEGFIEIKAPTRAERRTILREHNLLNIFEKMEEDKSVVLDTMDALEPLIIKSITKVSLKHINSGIEIKKIEDIQEYSEYDYILGMLMGVFTAGPKLGE